MTYASALQLPHQPEAIRHGAHSMGWFVLLVVASGFLAFAQDFLLGSLFPVQVALRVLLLVQILYILAIGRFGTQQLPSMLVFPIVLLSISMLATLLLQLVDGADLSRTLRAFYFMFGIGVFIAFLPFVPLSIERIPLFATFTVACVLFGTLQVLSQDLFLSEALLTEFGLVYVLFTSGSVRAVSFFNSAPRFAEFLVFVLCWLLFDIVSRRRLIFLKLMMYGVCLWLLFNTFSRSGYILFVVATAVVVFGAQRQIFGGRDIRGLLGRLFAVIALALLLAAVVGFVDFERLGITDSTSLKARFDHWRVLQERVAGFTLLQYLFGSGEAAMFSRSELEYFVVDNLFIALFLYSGLFALFAFLLLVASTIIVISTIMHSKSASRVLPALALYVGLIFQGFFVDNHNTIFLVQICLLGMIRAKWPT